MAGFFLRFAGAMLSRLDLSAADSGSKTHQQPWTTKLPSPSFLCNG
jgi:hypothetical protein